MKNYKSLLPLLLSLVVCSVYGQQGTTSAGDNFTSTDGTHHAYTIGEVFNFHTINANNSNKLGILQPIKRMPSAIIDAVLPMVNVFPNPAIEQLTVSIKDPEKFNYSIYDATGKKALYGQLTKEDIVLSTLEQGTYFIVIQNGTTSITKQLQIFKDK